jgi:uncharacterized protein (DUF2141 family)
MKKNQFILIIILLLLLILPLKAALDGEISGKIFCKACKPGSTIIKLYRLRETSEGEARRLQKKDIYGAINPTRILQLNRPGPFVFKSLPSGIYSILAYIDLNSNGKLDFKPPEPFGWYAKEIGGTWAVIDLRKKPNARDCDCMLRQPTPFPKEDKYTEHGGLHWIKGLPVLQLWGTGKERGFAHGYLVGKQILDFYEFYILEDSWRSPQRYQKIFIPFLENNFNYPPEFLDECDAVIKGMKASGIDIHLESLGRDFYRSDLLAINAYIERRAAFPVSSASSCTQFAFWGTQTEGSEVKKGLIAARNMDGECDIRKVTVSHFLLYAVDPLERGRRRWFSAMWPGFVGTISGINEEGLYSMENAGGTGPGSVVGGIVPCSWVERYILETMGQKSNPKSIEKILQSFRCQGGGTTAAGSIILFAQPYQKQKNPAFVYEGDRFGGKIRLPGEVPPDAPDCIMATNHHLIYGYNTEKPLLSFGKKISFSSAWRYQAGAKMLEAWFRKGKSLGLAEAKRLLQTVSQGYTEYSVIFSANTRRILIAVDDLRTDLWDAPYMPWVEFSFNELFQH